jgi:hypothetical protein
LEFIGAYKRSYGLAVTGDHDGIAVLGGTDILTQLGFDFCNGSYVSHVGPPAVMVIMTIITRA